MYKQRWVTRLSVFFYVLLLSVLLQNPVFSQSAVISSGIDSILKLTVPHSFNGVVTVAQNGQTIYQQAYGFADRDQKVPLTLKNQFIIGSISKQMTATLIMLEVEAGHIQLNKTINHYLPQLKPRWKDSVTVEQLLNHTSGIKTMELPLQNRPGRVFAYTNIAYELLAQILESVTHQSYAALATKLFDKCGMRNTTVPTASRAIRTLATGYMEEEDHTLTPTGSDLLTLLKAPSGGMISTAADLQRWNICLHQGKILKDATYRQMITPSSERDSRWGRLSYGYGVQVDELDDIREISHNGYVPGFISTNIYFPEKKLSLIVLENTSWLPADMSYTFFIEDKIRELLRAQITDNVL
ncbi:serine hydrolase domain-containing protein [Chitinophaga defluvii]|uniref:Serine hydrolase domain-containing protein n=1 Tax=Chitinophaga defluvii TaxID=3163343 RepID=A0ABV2TF01_9BACT